MKSKLIKGLIVTESQYRAIEKYVTALKEGEPFTIGDKNKTIDVLEELLVCYKEVNYI